MKIANNHLKAKGFMIAVITLSFLLAGCGETTSELIKQPGKNESWVVRAPIDVTFKTYKDYAEDNLTGGDFLWAEGLRSKAYFYGQTAELSLRLENNPFGQGTYLHFEFSKRNDDTVVNTWYYNGRWQDNAQKFKELLPTSVGAP